MRPRSRDNRASFAAGTACRVIAAFILLVTVTAGFAGPALAQDVAATDQSQVRFVHMSPRIGPVDVYIDGAIVLVGINFGAISDPIRLAAGDRSVVIAASGRPRDEELLETTVTLPDAANIDLSLLGPADDPSLAAHPVDLAPLPPDIARFNVVLGSFDVGPIDIELTGGDQLFPTLEYLSATEYADVAAGTYDLEASYAGVDTIVLEMPGIVLDAGVVYTVYVVGEAAAGELQSVISGWEADPVVVEGHPASIRAGSCQDAAGGQIMADLTTVSLSPFSAPVGAENAAVAESSFTVVGIPFEELTGAAHAVAVSDGDDPERIAACGEIGGTPSDDGSLVVGLRQESGSGVVGMAVLATNVIDPTVTDVSLFVSSDLVGPSDAPDPAAADETPPAIVVAPAAIATAATPEAGP